MIKSSFSALVFTSSFHNIGFTSSIIEKPSVYNNLTMRSILLLWGCLTSLLLGAQSNNKMISEGMPALSLNKGSQALSENATAITTYTSYRRNKLTFSLTIKNTGKPGTLLRITTTDLRAIPGLRANKNGHDIGKIKMDQYGFFHLSAGEDLTLSGSLNTTLEDVRIDWGDQIQSRAPNNVTKVETPSAPPSNTSNMISEDMPALSLNKGSQALSENVTAITTYTNYRESSNTLTFSLTIQNTGKPGTRLKVKTTNLRAIPGLRANKNGHDIGRPKINQGEFHTVSPGGRLTLSGRLSTTLEDVRIDWGDNIQSYTVGNTIETPPTPPSVEQNGYQGRKNCTEITNKSYFNDLKRKIKEELTDFTKIDVATEGVKGRCFNTAQIIELVELFSSDSSKLKFAKAAFSAAYDADNYHKIIDLLTFSSKKEELRNFIE